MEYGANILRKEASFYTLTNASISEGVLTIKAGGSAECEITTEEIALLTEHFKAVYNGNAVTDGYGVSIKMTVYAELKTGEIYNVTLVPVDTDDWTYTQEFQLHSGEYTKFTWRIESDKPITVYRWELCPEVSDLDISEIVNDVKQALPRVLYDYNTWPLGVSQEETTIAIITYYLTQQADIQGHFLMSFYATEPAILTLRCYTNEVEELFTPLLYDIHKGYNTIGVPHCYLHRPANSFSSLWTAQVTRGFLNIPTRGILYSIDANYLASREVNLGLDVRDLAIRQLSESAGPDEIWLIGIDAGEVLVRKRDYEVKNGSIQFVSVDSVGHGIAAAIEFDGTWTFRPLQNQYTLETESEPWYFWVDAENVLWGQHGGDKDSLVQLDTGVTAVSACRGYRSIQFLEQDQGLVVAYVKEGKPHYVQYTYNVSASKQLWQPPVQLVDEEFDDIRVHRLTDYRLSFELSGSERNLWIYTDRTYVNNAAPDEYFVLPSITDEGTWAYFTDDFTLSIVSQEASEDRMTYTVIYNKELKPVPGKVTLRQLITFSSGIVWSDDPATNMISDLTFVAADGQTTLVVKFSKSPNLQHVPKWNMSIILDAIKSPWFRLKVDGDQWIQSLQPQTALFEFDDTSYVSKAYTDSLMLPVVAQLAFEYIGTTKILQAVQDQLVLPLVTSSNFMYQTIQLHVNVVTDDCLLPIVSTIAFSYTQIADEPI